MKKSMKHGDRNINSGITPKNLSLAFLLSLAIIGAGCEQSQAADLNTNISPAEREKFVSEGSEYTNLREGTLTETGEGSIQIDTQTVNQVKKSLSSGKKPTKFFKSLSDKISNISPAERKEFVNEQGEFTNSREGKTGVLTWQSGQSVNPPNMENQLDYVVAKPFAPRNDMKGTLTGAAADITPTLDNLYSSGASSVQSAYQLTETTATSGNNVFKIGDKYYQMSYKDSFYEQFTNPTLDRAYEAGEASISSAYTLAETTSTSGNNVYKIGDKYFQLTVKPGVTSHSRVNGGTGGADVTDHFIKLSYSGYGGAISSSGRLGDITGDFIANYSTSAGAGAIHSEGTELGDIKGDFIGNHTCNGGYSVGAINVKTAVNGNITGNFIGNYAGYYAGAIWNASDIVSINSNFISNISGNNYSNAIAGAIINGGKGNSNTVSTIENITGSFIGNISETGSVGALQNGYTNNRKGYIGSITGDFIANAARIGTAGAIYNTSGSTINFLSGDFLANSAGTNGGAIYNQGTMNNVSSNFLGNNANTHGGAIYAAGGTTTLLADDTNNTISGNWIGSESNKQYEAIYVANTNANLNINAINGGTWTIYDYINGVSGYKLTLMGDGTGVIDYNNELKGSPNLTINNVTLDITDDSQSTYNLTSLTSTDGKVAIDLDANNLTADKFVTSALSTGTLTIDSLNVTDGDYTTWAEGTKVQIIQNGKTSSTLQLALSDALAGTLIDTINPTSVDEEIAAVTTWDKVYNTAITADGFLYEGLYTTTTTTENDSLTYGQYTKGAGTQYVKMGDTLALVNQSTLSPREFNATDDGETYTVTEDIGTTAAGIFTINGIEGGNAETIDFDGHSGFNVSNATTLNINNTTITNAVNGVIRATNANAEVNLTNVDFENNSSTSSGGAIYNTVGTFGDTVANFTNNSVTSETANAYGGAIYNNGANATIGDITGDFTENSISTSGTSKGARGGAIYNNNGSIGNITGDFVGNSAESAKSEADGGAIYNFGATAQIGDIVGNFSGNIANGKTTAFGGAINNSGTIGNITGDFTYNITTSSSGNGNAGAIYNYGQNGSPNALIGNITGNFIGNEADGGTGGAIYNDAYGTDVSAIIGNISGNFDSNKAIGGSAFCNSAQGTRAIATIGDVSGNFTNNGFLDSNGSTGTIYNISYGTDAVATIGNITGNFVNNLASYGAAITNYSIDSNAVIRDITGNFSGNISINGGGAIYNRGELAQIGNLTGDFTENTVISESFGVKGGAIYNEDSTIGAITGNFTNNSAIGKTETIGGAIYNTGTIGTITNSSITGNHAVSSDGEASGGAIYTSADMTLSSDNGITTIQGNYTESSGVRDDNAIYVDGATLTLEQVNGGHMYLYDNVRGANNYSINITGDNTGSLRLFNDLNDANVTIDNTTVNTVDNTIREYTMETLTSNNGKIAVDIDYDNGVADKFVTTGNATGTVYLSTLNLYGTRTSGTWQILDIASGDAELAFGDNIKFIENGNEVEFGEPFIFDPSMVDNTVTFGDIYASRQGLRLATTDTTNDSIEINPEEVFPEILTYLNQKETTDERNFNFVTSGDVYTVHEPIGTTTAGTLNINGVALGDDAKSTIDFNNTDGFNLANATTLNVENTKLTNATNSAVRVTNANAEVNLTNVDFEGNSSTSAGGAIYHTKGTLGDMVANFTNNSATSETANVYGGAIYNNGANVTMGDITGDFTGNSASTTGASKVAYGGAIYNNNGALGSITGDFSENTVSAYKAANGGAIYNSGASATMGDIEGNFSGNTATSETTTAYGGAIYNNNGTLGLITGDFTQNAINAKTYAYGGAIYNGGATAQFGDIEGNFSGNTATSETTIAYGGAICNSNGTLGSITGDFTQNAINAKTYADGGAIYNYGATAIIGDIEGNFSGNTATSETSAAYGGAIYNVSGTLGSITGDFTQNAINAQTAANGGAIYNYGATAQIGDIEGNFSGNTATSETSGSYGGAIYNASGTLGSITGDFENNSAISGSSTVYGSAIYNSGATAQIGDITGNFINNRSVTEKGAARGAVYNDKGTIGNITGDFISNVASGTTNSRGAAIKNTGTIGNITGNFINNSVMAGTEGSGAALDNTDGAVIGDVTGNFENNSVECNGWTYGGTIWNYGATIGNITGNIINSSATAGKYGAGGAIMNSSTSVLGNFTGNFVNNSLTADLYARGGALYNTGTIGDVAGSFINNHATSTSDSYLALGGAISHSGDGNLLKLVADNQDIVFDGNYTEDYRGKINNGIFVVTGDENTYMRYEGNMTDGYVTPKVMLSATNGGQFILNDNIDGGEIINENYDEETQMGTGQHLERNHQYDLEITGDDTGNVYLNNDILNANITHENVTTNVSDWSYLSHAAGEGINSLTMKSGVMNIPYLTTEPVTLSSFNMNGGTINLDRVDVDLKGETMGRFLADDYSGGGGTINVNSLNLLSFTDRIKTQILFADPAFASTVKYNGGSPIAYSPVYVYDVSYDQLANGGHFTFVRHGIGDDSGSFNPAVLASPITNEAAAMSTINHTFEYAFEHSDVFMNLPEFERFAQITGNRYALSTDFNDNIDQVLYMEQNKGVWVKPYTAFESIPLRHGPKVDSISYGTLIGGDTNLRQLANGWTNVGTLYIGYNGSQLDYAGVDTTTNGGLLGLTETFYRNNFFTAITATAGAGFAESHTMYGKEDTTFLMSGIASKTGYNIEFKNGKYILQPLLIANYSNVKVFDYTNAAGVDIKSDMAHNVQLVPTLKFIGNFENGWQPYASVGMVWNILHESNARANGIKLPEMYTKPYVQYGLGLQRRWGDKFTAYGQAMVRNGGRNGVALTAGFRWALGKDETKDENEKNVKRNEKNKKVSDSKPQPTEKVETQPVKKTVIKTLHPNKNVVRYKQLVGEM